MAASITVRALDVNGDPRRGNGQQNFLADIEAVQQILATRLRLFQGEWFEDTTVGLPLFQSILGHPLTAPALASLLRKEILAAPFVVGISSFSVVYAPAGRNWSFLAEVITAFGTVVLSNQPLA